MKKLIKFEKEGCAPCKAVDQYLKSKGVVATHIVDILSPESVDDILKYEIRNVPTLILEEDGVEVKRVIGLDIKSLDEIIGINRII